MNHKTALLPCPFCGGKAEFHIYNTTCLVECVKCHIGTTHHLIEEYENAIAAWNARAELGNSTCEMEYGGDITPNTAKVMGVYFCSECGSPTYNDCMPYYCIYCGKAVKR